ncbi:MAG: insulinase family protein [Geminicoccaceae bacterium]|nr:insulinase family protein [Geminicoccaceae bacterium]MCX7628738.1 insulinase family protein [Geminicoccaceae bacterium]MDW8341554.1 pitrilysin family protein [Geminicoccaceae bacterium]
MTPETRVTTLPNGFRVISEKLPGVRTAAVGVWVDAGTRHEPARLNGIAHLLEHMVFKGTRTRSAKDIACAIEAVGGSLNAWTSREHTAFHARVLAEDVPLAVELVADILTNPLLDEQELAKERDVVIQELGQVEDTPDDLVFDLFQERAFPDQPLGRSILGSEETIRAIARDSLLAFMAEHYVPGRMVLAAAGAVDHERLVALAERWFGEREPRPAPVTVRARYVGGRERDGRDLEQVHLCFGLEGVSYHDPDYWAVQVLATALGGGMSSRLFQEVRENRGLCYEIEAFSSSFADTGLFGIYTGTAPDKLEELLEVTVTETRSLVRDPEPAEIERAKAQLRAGLLMSLESCAGVADSIARQLLIYGRRIPVEELLARIEAVDREAVCRAGERLFASGGATTLALLGPVACGCELELGRIVA